MNKILYFTGKNIIDDLNIEDLENNLADMEDNAMFWIDIDCPEKKDIFFLDKILELSETTLSRCLEKTSHSMIVRGSDYIFMTLMNITKNNDDYISTPIYVYLHKNYLVTIRWNKSEKVDMVFNEAKQDLDLFKNGTSSILVNLFKMFAGQTKFLNKEIGKSINALKDRNYICDNKKLVSFKKDILFLTGILEGQDRILSALTKEKISYVKDKHKNALIDISLLFQKDINSLKDNSELINLIATLSKSPGTSDNKFLNTFLVATIPMLIITNIYGMNFKNMPELNMNYGYYGVLGFMIIYTFVQLSFMKKAK